MKTDEKARELASELLGEDQNQQPLIDVIMQMAEWKEQQTIEKACEWLKNNIHDYYMTNEFEQWFDDMFEDLKEAMKGGTE